MNACPRAQSISRSINLTHFKCKGRGPLTGCLSVLPKTCILKCVSIFTSSRVAVPRGELQRLQLPEGEGQQRLSDVHLRPQVRGAPVRPRLRDTEGRPPRPVPRMRVQGHRSAGRGPAE